MTPNQPLRAVHVEVVQAHDAATRPRYADLVALADPHIVRLIRRLQDEVRAERRREQSPGASPGIGSRIDRGGEAAFDRSRPSLERSGREGRRREHGRRNPGMARPDCNPVDWDAWERGPLPLPTSRSRRTFT